MTLLFRTPSGAVVAALRLFARRGTLTQLTPNVAEHWGEESVQLTENSEVDFLLSGVPEGWVVRGGGPVTLRQPRGTGTIAPGANAGRLTLTLEDADGNARATASLEVTTTKLGYRDDFRVMLEEIAVRATDLVLAARAPFAVTVRSVRDDPASRTQQFFFIRALLGSAQFREAVRRVLREPHQDLIAASQDSDLHKGGRLSVVAHTQLASRQPRTPVPERHPLRQRGIPTLPQQLPRQSATPTTNTPENRFVAHALQTFTAFLRELSQDLPEVRLRREARQHQEQLGLALQHPTLRGLSAPDRLPLGSLVLTRRAGYREIEQAYRRFSAAVQLTWDGGDAVFAAGRRDVATLYEYWVFFAMLAAVERVFGISVQTESLLELRTDGFGLKLRSGSALEILGVSETLAIRLSYNRTFAAESPVGSYSRALRPDLTLTLWPAALPETEAEVSQRLVHVHFDAKYRLDDLSDSFEREDLQKMHTYRDAIHRTIGAFVLYPGQVMRRWALSESGWPGVGALPLRPNAETDSLDSLLRELSEVVCRIVA